jgi:NitT/TauT family transport system permease protein
VSFHLLDIRRDVSRKTRSMLSILAWSLVVLAWFLLTESKLLPPFSLPKPAGVVRAFVMLWTDYDLLGNVFMSWWRIGQAFLWSAAIAIPLGLLMGSFRWLHHFINPIAAPMRAMPITAFLPAFIGLFGMEEGMKVAFLFFGMLFYLLALVVEEADRVD